MFDIGWSEMVFVAIIAVLVIGPKDLPKTIATIGKYIRKIRGVARDFQSGIDDLAKEAELDEIKKSVTGDDFNIKKQVEKAVDPTGDFSKAFEDIKPDIIDEKPQPEKADTAAVTAEADTSTTVSPKSASPAPEGEEAKSESKVST
ncbi:Sec-independent protein translocase protein TatB [Sneathiella glossodoripedis]|uniref:Sec-independent protein translocase protein TatB n=1 Tax=Sneathiella glossodoripedis TaxID=418853 RepID=UPI00046ED2CC|nr:Sec-independent protein translocase protein TatB [Sneathiella glossodoripedis]